MSRDFILNNLIISIVLKYQILYKKRYYRRVSNRTVFVENINGTLKREWYWTLLYNLEWVVSSFVGFLQKLRGICHEWLNLIKWDRKIIWVILHITRLLLTVFSSKNLRKIEPCFGILLYQKDFITRNVLKKENK